MAGKAVPSQARAVAQVLPRFAKAQADPFHDSVVGVKVPDDSTMPSVTNFVRSELPIITDSTYGSVCCALRAYPGTSFVVSKTVSNATTVAWDSSYGTSFPNSVYSTMQSAYEVYRPVAFGARITTRLNANTASGMVHIAVVAEGLMGTTWDYPNTVSNMAKAPWYRKVPLADLVNNEVVVSGLFEDMTAFKYTAPQLAIGQNAYVSNTGWGVILIFVEGGPVGANAIDVEQIQHYEGIVANSGGNLQNESPAAPYSPNIMAATKNMASAMGPIRVVTAASDENPKFLKDCVALFRDGLKVAQGIRDGISGITDWAASLF